MEMFNKRELDKRIGHLKKDRKLYNLEDVEGYVLLVVLNTVVVLLLVCVAVLVLKTVVVLCLSQM